MGAVSTAIISAMGIYCKTGISLRKVLTMYRQQRRVGARSLFCFWTGREMGKSLAPLAVRLGMSPAGIGYAVKKGEAIAHENGYQLIQ